MRDTKCESTYEEVKHLLLSNQYYAQLTLDCDCVSPYNEQPRRYCEHKADCGAKYPGFATEDYELRPIPYFEYIMHETPSRMKNIFAALEYDPRLTVGLWDEREGSFYGEKVPYLQRRRADGDDAWETLYRDAEYLSSDLLRFDHVKRSEDKSLFICAVAMNIKEFLEIKDFNLPQRMFDHFRRLLWWQKNEESWPDLLERNRNFLKASHEKEQWASSYAPYLGYLRQDCEKEEEHRSLVHLTDNGLLVLGGQGPDRGPDWRGGRTFQSTHKEYRRLPCLEFVVQDDPRSDFISNLIADVQLAVNIHRGDGSVYKTDPNCCEHIHRELKPDGLWEQQQVSERSLRHFCLDHLPVFREEEVLICTVAMKITENTKDMLMGKEEDFVEASTAFDLIHRILSNKGNLFSLNHVKNLHQLSEVYDNFINQNFERQDVEHLKRLRKNGLFVLTGPEFYGSKYKTYKIPLLKIAFLREPIKQRFIFRISQDPNLAVGSWNGQDGKFIARNNGKICGALRVHDKDCCFPKACEKSQVKIDYIRKKSIISLRGSVLEGVEPLKDQDVIICIIAMRTNKLIHHKDKTKLLDAIENFDIAERVAAHVEAVNSADSLSGIVSSKRMDDSDEDDRSHTRRRQKGMPQQLTSGLTKTKKSNIPDTLESVKGEAKDLKRKDAQSLSGVKLRDFEVKSIAVGGGDSISVLGRLRGADQLFVLSKTTLSRAFSKEDAENFWKQNSKVLDDARKRRDSYVKWREGLKFGGNIRRSKRING
ncbi:hypothetical protein IWW34DRAFT_812816 [Fusarium oxysporum f. sp. albedinis]|nr:hypothetical protein IWW34DRAFT_812816 [Fusarium oxysporum f. sp. albedinis]